MNISVLPTKYEWHLELAGGGHQQARYELLLSFAVQWVQLFFAVHSVVTISPVPGRDVSGRRPQKGHMPSTRELDAGAVLSRAIADQRAWLAAVGLTDSRVTVDDAVPVIFEAMSIDDIDGWRSEGGPFTAPSDPMTSVGKRALDFPRADCGLYRSGATNQRYCACRCIRFTRRRPLHCPRGVAISRAVTQRTHRRMPHVSQRVPRWVPQRLRPRFRCERTPMECDAGRARQR